MKKKDKILVEAVVARLQGKITVKQLQQILNDAGAKHMKVIDEDTIQVIVDNEPELFSRYDEVSGYSGSGLLFFGNIHGDHRMIQAIADDLEAAFILIK